MATFISASSRERIVRCLAVTLLLGAVKMSTKDPMTWLSAGLMVQPPPFSVNHVPCEERQSSGVTLSVHSPPLSGDQTPAFEMQSDSLIV
jgi:hypothetical protein